MIKAAIVGYGNIGKFVLDAVNEAPDFEIAGVVRRDATNVPEELKKYKVVSDLSELEADVAILCTPTRKVEEYAVKALSLGMNTVDSFDIHTNIVDLRRALDKAAKEHGKVSIISAGWDPVAVKAIEGVKAALSMTIPLGTGIHRRMVYVELLDGYNLPEVAAAIKADPYFANDETHVIEVPSVDDVKDMGHGVMMTRKGVSGITQNQRFEFSMQINNPALTAQVLVGVARASMKQQPGAYTMIEIPVIDLLPGDREELVRHLV